MPRRWWSILRYAMPDSRYPIVSSSQTRLVGKLAVGDPATISRLGRAAERRKPSVLEHMHVRSKATWLFDSRTSRDRIHLVDSTGRSTPRNALGVYKANSHLQIIIPQVVQLWSWRSPQVYPGSHYLPASGHPTFLNSVPKSQHGV